MSQFLALVQLGLLALILAVCAPLLGRFMARVFQGQPTWLTGSLGWLETLILRGCGACGEMSAREYLWSVLVFSAVCVIALLALILAQTQVPFLQALEIAVSFVTNTNWQSYSGEVALSPLVQALGLGVQNFVSAGVGMAVAVALFRAFAVVKVETIGNFWVDLTRSIVYILLPLSLLYTIALGTQGVVQTLGTQVEARGPEQAQTIITGPVASQVAIKMLGSNGGGYYGANGAHPYENPTPLSNFLQTLAILLIPAGLVFTFGHMIGDLRQSVMIVVVMALLFVPAVLFVEAQESMANPILQKYGVASEAGDDQSGGNASGKEVRFGAHASAIWSTATTATSNGSVNGVHEALMPLSQCILMLSMQAGDVMFGGVGTGMIGMLLYIFIAVFIAGLMVGRTPEYLGKKLGPFEIKMVSLVLVVPAACILGGAIWVLLMPAGRAGMTGENMQALSQVLYGLTSMSRNNGSAMSGLQAGTDFYHVLATLFMLLGRFVTLGCMLMLAGSMAQKTKVAPSIGTLPTHTALFVFMLVGVILLIDVLTYAPALILSTVAEHLHMYALAGAAL